MTSQAWSKINKEYSPAARILSDLCKLFKARNDFSLLHMNLRSLSLHYDELCFLPVKLKLQFDIIGIAKTKEQWDKGFVTNVSLSGYDVH